MSEYLPARWTRLKGQLLRLEGTNCEDCRVKHFPPRPICPESNCPSRSSSIGKPTEVVYQSGAEVVNPLSS